MRHIYWAVAATDYGGVQGGGRGGIHETNTLPAIWTRLMMINQLHEAMSPHDTKVLPAICTRSMNVNPPSSRGSLLTVKRWAGDRRISPSWGKNE